MIDPRFEQVLEFIEELDENGAPTVRAKLALKIRAYSQEVDNLRKELAEIEESIGGLESTVLTLSTALEEQTNRKIALVTEAQDAAVRAAMEGSGGASANFRKMAQATRERIAEFEKNFEADSARMANAQISLDAKQQGIKDTRDSIVRRLNTMSSLAERAGLEFGTELLAPTPQAQPRVAAPRMVRRRPRRVRVHRRRAS
jgi:phage shock protein A